MGYDTKSEKLKNGVFLALKLPEGREPEFSGIGSANCTFITNVSTFWKSFGKSNGYMKSYEIKCSILNNLGLFMGF